MARINEYARTKIARDLPRLPLTGNLDITHRCNNRCRHCWISLPARSQKQREELTFGEIRAIVDDAREMGCRVWRLSGGEPMIRPDFPEIFEYVTDRSATFFLNTNGTFITPRIAKLLTKKGTKMISLYGATAEVHDFITRNPGSYEAALQGMAYLREVNAGFIVQLVPMKANLHQWERMVGLAEGLSPRWRIGAEWLTLSASGSPSRNAEIKRQRLEPGEMLKISPPDLSAGDLLEREEGGACAAAPAEDDRIYALCVATQNKFYVDPHGRMSFCAYVKAPEMFSDLRSGSFRDAWENFIPSLADRIRGGKEYRDGCASCESRRDCCFCGAYSFLETRRHGAVIESLCRLTEAKKAYGREWARSHIRHFQIAGVTVRVGADLPITAATFAPKFRSFEVSAPGTDVITIHHHFSLPEYDQRDLGKEIYRKPPWAIYNDGNSYTYVMISPLPRPSLPPQIAVFNGDYSRARIYNKGRASFLKGGLPSLTFFPTDQILLSQVLSERRACYMHSAGAILDGKGLLFVGHSEAGKSTTVKILAGRAEILCDDRNIVRRWPEGFRIHGSWSHGEVKEVSPASAPLRAVLFLHKSGTNRLVRLDNSREIIQRLLACLIKPFVTGDWWDRTLALVEALVTEIPCYRMEFDKSGKILAELEKL